MFSKSRFIIAAAILCCLRADPYVNPALARFEAALSANDIPTIWSLEKRLLSETQDVDTLLTAGALLAQHNMLREAAVIFAKCSQRFPSSFEAKYNLALAYIGLNDYRAAEHTLQEISPISVHEFGAMHYLQGKVASATGQPEKAHQNFEDAYRSDPQNENYTLDLALLDIQASAYIPALQILRPTLARHPESEELKLELALADALAGQRSEALAMCHKLSRQNPNLSTPRVIAAFAHCMDGNYPACEADAAAGLQSPHPDPYLYYLHAEALWNSGSREYPEMLRDLNAAVAHMPFCNVCLVLRSKVFEAKHDYQTAIADLKQSLTRDPQFADAWCRLSVLYRRAGLSAEAADSAHHCTALLDRQVNGEVENFRKQLINHLNN